MMMMMMKYLTARRVTLQRLFWIGAIVSVRILTRSKKIIRIRQDDVQKILLKNNFI